MDLAILLKAVAIAVTGLLFLIVFLVVFVVVAYIFGKIGLIIFNAVLLFLLIVWIIYIFLAG